MSYQILNPSVEVQASDIVCFNSRISTWFLKRFMFSVDIFHFILDFLKPIIVVLKFVLDTYNFFNLLWVCFYCFFSSWSSVIWSFLLVCLVVFDIMPDTPYGKIIEKIWVLDFVNILQKRFTFASHRQLSRGK